MSDEHKAKNRRAKSLPVLDIRIEWEGGELLTDPNGACMMAVTGDWKVGPPSPKFKSHLTGEPGYRLSFDNIRVCLTFDEMDRLYRHDLVDDEYFALRKRYGMFHEIHEDFYYPEDGVAWQPISDSPAIASGRARAKALWEGVSLEGSVPVPAKKRKPGSA